MENFCNNLLLETMEEQGGGIAAKEKTFPGGRISLVKLPPDNPYGRPAGRYTTVELDALQSLSQEALREAVRQISEVLIGYISGKKILVAALGNNEITPDSLGPKMIRHLMVTRPLERVDPSALGEGRLRSVAAICTNVYGVTGVESAEMIAGVSRQIGAECAVVIDALATAHLSRLCSTVQISDSGISPGGGLDNHRPLVNEESLGIPVISIGMPTVMKGEKLAEFFTSDQENIQKQLAPYPRELIVTPAQIGAATDEGARLIAYSLNRAMHYRLAIEDMLKYLS